MTASEAEKLIEDACEQWDKERPDWSKYTEGSMEDKHMRLFNQNTWLKVRLSFALSHWSKEEMIEMLKKDANPNKLPPETENLINVFGILGDILKPEQK